MPLKTRFDTLFFVWHVEHIDTEILECNSTQALGKDCSNTICFILNNMYYFYIFSLDNFKVLCVFWSIFFFGKVFKLSKGIFYQACIETRLQVSLLIHESCKYLLTIFYLFMKWMKWMGFEMDLNHKVVDVFETSRTISKRKKESSNDELFKEYEKRKSKWRHL